MARTPPVPEANLMSGRAGGARTPSSDLRFQPSSPPSAVLADADPRAGQDAPHPAPVHARVRLLASARSRSTRFSVRMVLQNLVESRLGTVVILMGEFCIHGTEGRVRVASKGARKNPDERAVPATKAKWRSDARPTAPLNLEGQRSTPTREQEQEQEISGSGSGSGSVFSGSFRLRI